MKHQIMIALALAGLAPTSSWANEGAWHAIDQAINDNDAAAFTAAVRQTGLDTPLAEADELTPLLFLIHYRAKNTACLRALLDAGADPNAAAHGVIPLCQAAYLLHGDIADMLLQAGATPNDDSGASPALFSAIRSDRSELGASNRRNAAMEQSRLSIIRKLVAAGADINAPDKEGASPLSAALATDNAPVVQLLLELGARALQADDPNADCIFRAARSRDKQFLDLCLQAGLPINIRNKDGESPLFEAARKADGDFLRYMLSRGASPDYYHTQNPYNPTPLFCTLANKEPEERQLDALQTLLDTNCRIYLNEQRRHDGESVLIEAAQLDKPQIVSLLLERGANLHAKDLSGNSALMAAIKAGAVSCVELLLQKGARTDETDNASLPPLAQAAALSKAEQALPIMRMLMEQGLEPDERTLFRAASKGAPETVRFLLDKGLSPNATVAHTGNTLLHLASPACTEVLLAAGADPNKANVAGNTPLHFTIYVLPSKDKDAAEKARMLIKAGANPAAHNNYGKTPLDSASGETARVLREALSQPSQQQ